MNPDDNAFPAPPSPSPNPMRPEPEKITATHNPYEFIVNPATKSKKGRGGSAGDNPFLMRILVVVGGAVVVMFVVGFLVNTVFGKRANPAELVGIAETQTEIARVAHVGAGAQFVTVRNAAINTEFTLTSQQQALVGYLLKQGTKVGTKELVLKKSVLTDQQLATAAAANTFDTVFTQKMVGELQTYAATLKTTYNHATGKNERALLSADYTQTQQLLAQWPAVSTLTN